MIEKNKFKYWKKKELIDLLQFFEYNFPKQFAKVSNRFEGWKRGD